MQISDGARIERCFTAVDTDRGVAQRVVEGPYHGILQTRLAQSQVNFTSLGEGSAQRKECELGATALELLHHQKNPHRLAAAPSCTERPGWS